MKYAFKLSKTNWVFLGIFGLLVLILEMFLGGFSAYSLGGVFGILFVYFVLSLIPALIVWFIFGRKQFGGTTTFNIALIIMVLLYLLQFTTKLATLVNSNT